MKGLSCLHLFTLVFPNATADHVIFSPVLEMINLSCGGFCVFWKFLYKVYYLNWYSFMWSVVNMMLKFLAYCGVSEAFVSSTDEYE